MDKKNIVFVTDENQVDYALTNSFLIFNQTKSNDIIINIVLLNVSSEKRKFIENFKLEKNLFNLNLIYIKNTDFELGVSNLSHITVAANIRLYLSTILENVDNVLYLDNDTVVEGDINELFEFAKKGSFYGVPWSKFDMWPKILKFKGLFNNKYYVNSGVIYLDLKYIRENGIEKKFINHLLKKKQKLLFVDQDILNCELNFEPLPYVWNIARSNWQKHHVEFSNSTNLKIYHFLSKEKQWGEFFGEINKVKKGGLNKKEMKLLIEPQLNWKKTYSELFEK